MDTQSFHLFLQAPVGITVLKAPDYIVEMANQQYLEIVDKEEKNFVGLPLLEALPEIRDQGFTALLDNVIATKQPYRSTESLAKITRNGLPIEIYINFIYQPITEKDGTVDRILAVVNDVTEMVIARNKITEAEERTRLAVEAAHIGTFEWDLNNDVFLYSKRSCEVFGLKERQDLNRKHFSNLIHPDDRQIRSAAHAEAAKTGLLQYECRIVWEDGSVHWVKINGKTFLKKKSGPYKMYGTILDITEQKTSADILRQNEDQLRVALEAANMGYWNVDPQNLTIFCSDLTQELFGLSCDSQTDIKSVLGTIHKEDRKRVVQDIKTAWQFASGGNFDCECRVISKRDGKERVLHSKGKTFFTNAGVPFRFSGTVQDISEYTKATKSLEESEQRYRQLIAGLPVAVYTVDEKGFVKIYNQAAVKLWGRTPEPGQEHWYGSKSLSTIDGRKVVRDDYPTAVAIRENRALCTEAVVERPDGEKRFVLAYPEPVHDLDGTITGAINVVVDITERSLAEAALEESEARFRLLSNFMPQLIWAGDAAGNLNYYNQAVYNYSGLSYEQIQNDGWLRIVHPDDRAENTKKWIHSVTTGEDFFFEHRFLRHDGEFRWQLSRALPQKDANGAITMWIGTSTDIHDQKINSEELEKRVEERTADLKKANYSLEQSNQELEQFAFAASHDMQEPLRKIQTFITFLHNIDGDHLSEKGKSYLEKINNASLRMKALIDSLLNYSQLSNYNNTNFVLTDLNNIVDDVKNDLELIITEKQAIIESDTLPVIAAIPLQMNQLFYNLISNSLKFAKSDILPVIKIGYERKLIDHIDVAEGSSNRQAMIDITIRDNGIGFNQKYANKIFDLFQRLNDRYSYDGTGIGLALCKKVVHNHGGEITAESAEGMGTLFKISLPA